MDFLHFIGNQYYTKASFIKEAKKYGITRKIPFRSLKSVNMGDRVFLMQGGHNGGRIFGYFVVDRVTLQNPNLVNTLMDNGYLEKNSDSLVECALVERGCGEYEVQGSYHMTDPDRMMNYIKSMEKDAVGDVMIGGTFHPLTNAGIDQDEISSNIPHAMGIRPFDFEGFRKSVEGQKGKKRVRVVGMFYSKAENLQKNGDGFVLEIANYKKN